MTQSKNARYGINIFRSEKYYTDEVAEHLEDIVNMSKNLMQEIAVIDYLKVASYNKLCQNERGRSSRLVLTNDNIKKFYLIYCIFFAIVVYY